ncbi:MAG: cellulase family glycosylhydrolase [Ruminococcus sp.]|nr:cellulase family glycosylhydrolase [Ruminococcus sp.]
MIPGEAEAVSGQMREISTMELVRDMGIGINLGNTMEACGDWIAQWGDGTVSSYETAWGSPVITEDMISGYAEAGFGVLRIPVAWSNLMGDNYTISPDYMARVQQIVDWTLDANMYAIINIHYDNGWVNKFPDNKDECMKRYTTMWDQICEGFKDYGDHLMFESQNEELGWDTLWNKWGGTNGKDQSYALVNEINQKFVDTVRASGGNNSQRHLLISGYNTDLSCTCDSMFKMPDDPAGRMAVSVHYYSPVGFAILEEDADWGKASSTWGTQAEVKTLQNDMDQLKYTFIDKGVPVIIGEYGCPIKNKELDSIRRFLTSVCSEAYSRQLCPVMWDTPGGQYDRKSCKMSDTVLQQALLDIAGDNIPANKVPETTEAAETTVTTEEDQVLTGDANADGKLDLNDAVAILQYVSLPAKYPLSDEGMAAADCCDPGDGITGKDALAIQMLDSKLISSLPYWSEQK